MGGGAALKRRKEILYDVLFIGGNIEWFFGSQPLPLGGVTTAENFRLREDMWNQVRYAQTVYRDGTTHVLFERGGLPPLDFMAKLAALGHRQNIVAPGSHKLCSTGRVSHVCCWSERATARGLLAPSRAMDGRWILHKQETGRGARLGQWLRVRD